MRTKKKEMRKEGNTVGGRWLTILFTDTIELQCAPVLVTALSRPSAVRFMSGGAAGRHAAAG